MTNRERLFRLMGYLYMNTDDEHQVDTRELTLAILGEDTPAKRKTIKEDIMFLEAQQGIDIVIHKGSPDRYQWGTRIFDTAEVKLMVDSVASSNMLTTSMSERFIDRLLLLVSRYENEKLRRHLYIPEHLKVENVQIFYTTDKIVDAIDSEKKVKFRYMMNCQDEEKGITVKEKRPDDYCISPYSLALENGRYYMIGYYEEKNIICPFRIDRIRDLKITDEPAVKNDDFNIKDFLHGTFRMFCGRRADIVLECSNDWMNSVFDHFGRDVTLKKIDNDSFRLETSVQLSPTFYAWLFEAGNKVKIVEPADVLEEYVEMLKKSYDEYN